MWNNLKYLLHISLVSPRYIPPAVISPFNNRVVKEFSFGFRWLCKLATGKHRSQADRCSLDGASAFRYRGNLNNIKCIGYKSSLALKLGLLGSLRHAHHVLRKPSLAKDIGKNVIFYLRQSWLLIVFLSLSSSMTLANFLTYPQLSYL